MTNSDRGQRILEWIYGLLEESEAEAIRAEIESDPSARAEYERMLEASRLFSDAARLRYEPMAWNPEAIAGESTDAPPEIPALAAMATSAGVDGNPTQSANQGKAVHVLWPSLTSLAACLALGWFAFDARRRLDDSSAPGRGLVALRMATPETFSPGIGFAVDAWTESVDGNPISAEVALQLKDKAGNSIHEQRQSLDVPADRTVHFRVPANLPLTVGETAQLSVAVKTSEFEDAVSTPVRAAAGRTKAALSTDRPSYRPGETVLARSVAFDRLLSTPVADQLRFSVRGPAGEKALAVSENKWGVQAAEWSTPANAPAGRYRLFASHADVPVDAAAVPKSGGVEAQANPEADRDIAGSVDFFISPTQSATADADVEFLRDSYRPGDEVVAQIAFPGTPATIEEATVQLKSGEALRPTVQQAGANRYRLAFKLPDGPAASQATLAATYLTEGSRRSLVRETPMTPAAPRIVLYPEGGGIVAGISNRVYFAASGADGKPVALRGQVENPGGELRSFESVRDGLGLFEAQPEPGRPARVRFELPEAENRALFELSADQRIALSAGSGVADANGTLQLKALCAAPPASLLVVASVGETAVAQTAITAKEPISSFELPLPPEAAGIIRVTAFETTGAPGTATLTPVSERLVYRKPVRQLNVAALDASERYTPGDAVHLGFVLSDENRRPVQGVLGVTVFDESTLRPGDRRQSGFLTSYWLLAGIQSPAELDNANFYLEANPESARALDLLLGTQGWRRIRTGAVAGVVKAEDLKQADRVAVPALIDNWDSVRRRMEVRQAAFSLKRSLANRSILTACSITVAALALLWAVWLAFQRGRFPNRSWHLPVVPGRVLGVVGAIAAMIVASLIIFKSMPKQAHRPAVEAQFAARSEGAMRNLAVSEYDEAVPPSTGQAKPTRRKTESLAAKPTKKPAQIPPPPAKLEAEPSPSPPASKTLAEPGDLKKEREETSGVPKGAMPAPSPAPAGDLGGSVGGRVAKEEDARPRDVPLIARPKSAARESGLVGKPADEKKKSLEAPAEGRLDASVAKVRGKEPALKPATKAGGEVAPGGVKAKLVPDPKDVAAAPDQEVGKPREDEGRNNMARPSEQPSSRLKFDSKSAPANLAAPESSMRRNEEPKVARPGMATDRAAAANTEKKGVDAIEIGAAPGPTTRGEGASKGRIDYFRERRYVPTAGRARADFPPTVYWNPLIETDVDGIARVNFPLPDAVTRYRVIVNAHAPGRLGSTDLPLAAEMPFSVDPAVPALARVGDRFDVPVNVRNRTDRDADATVTCNVADGLKLVSGNRQMIRVAAQTTAIVWFTIEAVAVTTRAEIETACALDALVDVVRKAITIAPAAATIRRTIAGQVEENRRFAFTGNTAGETAISVRMRIWPSIVAELKSAVEAIETEPGSTEDRKAAEAELIRMAYGRLVERGGVDPDLVRRARHSTLDVGFTPSIVQNRAPSPQVNILLKKPGQPEDALALPDGYSSASQAYLLAEMAKMDAANEMLNRVAAFQLEDGSIGSPGRSGRPVESADQKIEATAMAALAWMRTGKEEARAGRAVNWLVRHRRVTGGFGAVRTTFFATLAIADWETIAPRKPANGTWEIAHDNESLARGSFSEHDHEPITATAKLQGSVAGAGVRFTGDSSARFAAELELRDSAPSERDARAAASRLKVRWPERPVVWRALESIRVEVAAGERGMTNAEAVVPIPAGMSLQIEDIRAFEARNGLTRLDAENGQVTLSIGAIPASTTRSFALPVIASAPGRFMVPAARLTADNEPIERAPASMVDIAKPE